MKKKEYERPAMQVVQLKQQQPLLAGSNADGYLLPPMGDSEDL